MAGKGKPGPAPLFGRALEPTERQRRWRDSQAVRLATAEARVREQDARIADLEAQLAAAPAGDPLAGGSVAIAGEIIQRLGKRKAVEVARRILAPASAPPR